MVGQRVLRFLGTLAVTAAASYLAYLTASFLLLEWPRLFLAAVTKVEFLRFEAQPGYVRVFPRIFPHAATRFPADGSAPLYALYTGSALLWGAVVLWLASLAGRRASGWLRVYFLHTVLWTTALLALYSGVVVGWPRASLGAALRVLWPAQADSLALHFLRILIALLLLLALHLAIRAFLDSVAETGWPRLLALGRWLVLPAALVGLALHLPLLRFRSFFVVAFIFGPALLGLLAGLPGALARSRPAPPLRPSLTGAAVVVVVLGLVVGASAGYDELALLTQAGNFLPQQSRYWRLQIESPSSDAVHPDALAAEADRRVTEMAARLGVKLPNPGLRARYHSSTETKRALAGDDKPFTLARKRAEIHHLLTQQGEITDPRGDALLLLHTAWGEPGSNVLAQALARYAVGCFYGVSLADFAGRITREEEPYTLREIFELDIDYLSPLVRDALGGAWIEFVAEHRGQKAFELLYRAPLAAGREDEFAQVLNQNWEELERDWRGYLLAAAERAGEPAPPRPPDGFFHRGISFSHEVGGGYGYGSDLAREQLARIRETGANSIAIVPYAFTRAPHENRIRFGTDESDDRVIRTVQAAQALGLRTLLKPQLWGTGFTGDIGFENKADFDRWFALYRRWLLHHGRLAELYRVDVLVIGTELGGVTHHEAAWRALIADLRRVYRGPLTYAANWGEEFETLRFWDALDYLGVSMYYPLAEPGQAPLSDPRPVRERIELFAARARQYGKPVLFTEVGYPATATAATEPWKEEGGALDVALQARCYTTVFEAFYNQPWLAGLYWWKWPSHGRGNRFDASYNPLGKPAVEIIKHWYSESAAREEIGWPPETRYTHPNRGEEQ